MVCAQACAERMRAVARVRNVDLQPAFTHKSRFTRASDMARFAQTSVTWPGVERRASRIRSRIQQKHGRIERTHRRGRTPTNARDAPVVDAAAVRRGALESHAQLGGVAFA